MEVLSTLCNIILIVMTVTVWFIIKEFKSNVQKSKYYVWNVNVM